jgi:hypothetical protein
MEILPRTAEADILAGELLRYEIRVSEDANDRYGAFKVGTHDDLVTALGLAVQPAPRPPHLLSWRSPGAAPLPPQRLIRAPAHASQGHRVRSKA